MKKEVLKKHRVLPWKILVNTLNMRALMHLFLLPMRLRGILHHGWVFAHKGWVLGYQPKMKLIGN
jgi:hypothetical protein